MDSMSSRYLHKETQIITRRLKRRIVSRNKRKLKNQLKSSSGLFIKGSYAYLKSPPAICLYEKKNCTKTIFFSEQIRKQYLEGRQVRLDFSDLKYVSAAGMLLVLSTVDFCRRKYGQPPICDLPLNKKMRSVFKQTGFLEIIGRTIKNTEEYPDVNFWNFTTGTQVDGEKTNTIVEQLIGYVAKEKQRKLFSGMQEAIANSVEHAYKNSNRSQLSQLSRWWGFGGIKDKTAIVLVCDLGLGIPNTVTADIDQGWLDKALGIFGGRYDIDSNLIHAATRKGETQTENKHRGHGLAEIRQFIEHTPGGNLAIYSNRGVYKLKVSKMTSRVIESEIGHKRSIHGTIIEWEIPLEDS